MKHFDLDQIYLPDALREILDRVPDQRTIQLSIGGEYRLSRWKSNHALLPLSVSTLLPDSIL